MQFIAPDLYRNIIEYVPRTCLWDLSKASPIFDTVICSMGIRIFYDESIYYDISFGNAIVIHMLRSGRKYVLFNLGCSWYVPESNSTTNVKKIRWISPKDITDDYLYDRHYDSKQKISVYTNGHTVYFIKDDVPYTRTHINYRAAVYDRIKDGRMHYIDFDSKIAVTSRTAFMTKIIDYEHWVESFRVVYQDCCWTHRIIGSVGTGSPVRN